MTGIIQGINLTVLYLGGVKVAIVMWLYGIERFCTDVQFSLGFRPTQFWTTSWSLLPILTLVSCLQPLLYFRNNRNCGYVISLLLWKLLYIKCGLMWKILQVFIIHKVYVLINTTERVQMILASTWIVFSLCFVTVIQTKTAAKYLVRNVSIFFHQFTSKPWRWGFN